VITGASLSGQSRGKFAIGNEVRFGHYWQTVAILQYPFPLLSSFRRMIPGTSVTSTVNDHGRAGMPEADAIVSDINLPNASRSRTT
jgi:hypothetical protein